MIKGSVRQRHSRLCPKSPDGTWAQHRCRGGWEYVVEAGRDANGRRRQVTKGGFASRKDAVAALDRCLDDLRGGIDVETRLTVGEYLESWLASKRSLRPSTAKSYRYHIRLYLNPLLGHVRLRELRAHQVDVLIDELSKTRGARVLSSATVRRIYSTLRVALNDAVRRRLIPYNPAEHVDLPTERRAPVTVWTSEQVAQFLSASRNDRLYPAYHLVVMSGMRRGEVCGLRWSDVDLDRGLLRISQAVVQLGGPLHLGPPKTRAGVRSIALDDLTVEVLRMHRDRQSEERRAWGAGYQDYGMVFANENGTLISPERLSRNFRHASKRADLPVIRFHDLRHTSASLALAAGVALKVVSERLGHSTIGITADLYTHVVPAVARDAANAIARTVSLIDVSAPRERIVSAGDQLDESQDHRRKGA